MENSRFGGAFVATAAFWLLVGVVLIPMWGCPRYNVWERGMKGRAELAQADFNRQIQTVEAEAKKQAAKSLADAEVIRAEGVAKANQIIGESLKGNEDYLRYLWVQGIEDRTNTTVVYVPTEANLPILEAGRKP